jgi:hypothetical protein
VIGRLGVGEGDPTGVDDAWGSRVGVIARLRDCEGAATGNQGMKKVLEPARGAIFQSFLTRHLNIISPTTKLKDKYALDTMSSDR